MQNRYTKLRNISLVAVRNFLIGLKYFNCCVLSQKSKNYVYCPHCDKLSLGWDIDEYKKHPHHDGHLIDYPGVYIKVRFAIENTAHFTASFIVYD